MPPHRRRIEFGVLAAGGAAGSVTHELDLGVHPYRLAGHRGDRDGRPLPPRRARPTATSRRHRVRGRGLHRGRAVAVTDGRLTSATLNVSSSVSSSLAVDTVPVPVVPPALMVMLSSAQRAVVARLGRARRERQRDRHAARTLIDRVRRGRQRHRRGGPRGGHCRRP